MAQFFSNAVEVLKDHPVVTSIAVALVASAILNRVPRQLSVVTPQLALIVVLMEFGSTTLNEEQGTARPPHGNEV
jgi:lipopolysaccharide export LptBFGC system permease protein LptF